MLRGIDAYHGQGIINHQKVAASGVQFAIFKAADGITTQDAMVQTNLAGARLAGLVVGVYFYFESADDPILQAQNFLKQIENVDYPLILALDLEGSGWDKETAQQRGANVQAFLDYVEERWGPMILYFSPDFANEYLQFIPLGVYKWWIADYGGSVPAGFASYAVWQYSQTGTCPGVNGPVDLNRFEGDLAALCALAVSKKAA